VYYASDYVEYKSMYIVKRIERKKSLLDSIIQKEKKLKKKDAIKARKAKAAAKKDSLLNRKRFYSRGDYKQ
jgi:hypothetical protein